MNVVLSSLLNFLKTILKCSSFGFMRIEYLLRLNLLVVGITGWQSQGSPQTFSVCLAIRPARLIGSGISDLG